MKESTLRTDLRALRVGTVKAGLIVLFTCVLITIVFRAFLGLGLNVERYLLWSMWVLLPGMWVIGSMIIRDKWRKTTYQLTNDALVIHKGSLGGGSNQQMYRYDAIIAVNVKQDFWGSKYGYGDVYLEIPRLGQHIQLRGICEPDKQAQALKANVARQGNARPLDPS